MPKTISISITPPHTPCPETQTTSNIHTKGRKLPLPLRMLARQGGSEEFKETTSTTSTSTTLLDSANPVLPILYNCQNPRTLPWSSSVVYHQRLNCRGWMR